MFAPPDSRVIADFTHDGRPDLAAIADRGPVEIWSPAWAPTPVWRGLGKLHPVALLAADVEGDGRAELLVTVHKTARYDPTPRDRPFVFRWDGKDFQAIWRGTSLSRPFTHLAAGRVLKDGAPKLVAAEWDRSGQVVPAAYSWTGFGFSGEWEGAAMPPCEGLLVIEPHGAPPAEVVAVAGAGHTREVLAFAPASGQKEPVRRWRDRKSVV